MQVQVLFNTKGEVHAIFHPSSEANAPQLEFHPARGQRTALLTVPAELHPLSLHALHAAVRVKMDKVGPSLVARKRGRSSPAG
jgi:hypothetical protein